MMRDTETGSLGLQIQVLAAGLEQTIVLGHVAGLQNKNATFTPRDVVDLVQTLRLPAIANVSANLRRLKDQGLVVSHSPGTWSMTPLGDQRSRNLIGDL